MIYAFNKDYSVIAIIREYENSVSMPDDEQKTYIDEQQNVHLKAGDDKASSPLYEEYAHKCVEYLRFGKEVDEVIIGQYNRHDHLKICNTPQILLDAGFEQKPILYTQNHLRLAVSPKTFSNPHKHGLPIQTIKKLPSLFESPVILADNPSREDAMLIVLCEVDRDKLPLIASIKPDGHGNYQLEEIETNLILTVFGKDNFDRYFASVLTADRILYLNKGRGQTLERLSERQLLGDYSRLNLFNIIIRKPQCIVNLEKSENVKPSLKDEVNSMRQSSKELSDSSLNSFTKNSIKGQEGNR